MELSANVVKAFVLVFVVVLFTAFVSLPVQLRATDLEDETQPPTTTETTSPTTTTTQTTTAASTEATTTTTTTTAASTAASTAAKTTTKTVAKTTTQPSTAKTTQYGTTTVRESFEFKDPISVTQYILDEEGSRVTVLDEFGSTVYATTIVYETVDSAGQQDETEENENVFYNTDVENRNLATKKVVLIVLIVATTVGVIAFALSFLGKKK